MPQTIFDTLKAARIEPNIMIKNTVTLLIIIFTLSSCGKDKIEYSLNVDSLNLKRADTYQLTVVGSSKSDAITYTSSNNYIASVDSNGLVKGQRVGKVDINVKSSFYIGDCVVTVLPVYNTFVEPITEFGLTKSEVKAIEKRTLNYETDEGMLFLGTDSEKSVIYLFDDAGKSYGACIVISYLYTSDLSDFILERYIIVSTDPIIGMSIDQSYSLEMELQTSLDWWVMYAPTSKSANANFKQVISELILKSRNGTKDR